MGLWDRFLAAFQGKEGVSTMARDLLVGESLVGEGNEIAHIDLMIGPKSGPAGTAFANCLARQSSGHNALLAVLEPNLPAKPMTVMFNKVTIKGAGQAVQMFGPAQFAVAKAVVDSVADGVLPKDKAEDWVVIVGVFIHWDAKDNKKIFDYNYRATKEAIARAVREQPSVDEVVSKRNSAKHPFA
jgi:5,6,7,8-tetrahydromethanopterin hydro-lyase